VDKMEQLILMMFRLTHYKIPVQIIVPKMVYVKTNNVSVKKDLQVLIVHYRLNALIIFLLEEFATVRQNVNVTQDIRVILVKD